MAKSSRQAARTLITAQAPATRIEWASPVQSLAFRHGPAPTCLSGGFGAAKTYTACLKALYLCDMFPGNVGVIARRIWEELKKTTMATFFKLCPPEAYAHGRRADSEKILRLNNGSTIYWLHLDDAETEKVIRGLEINWFLLDQAEETPEETFDLLSSRLGRWDRATVPQYVIDRHRRATGHDWPWLNNQGAPIPPTYAMLTCNPDTEMHWIWRRFHPDSPDRHEPRILNPLTGRMESYYDLGYQMFTMSSLDNKFLSRQARASLMSKDPAFVKRFVYGYWGMPEGRIHTVPPESIVEGSYEFVQYLLRNCTLHRTLDHGDSSPTACLWWAVDREGNCFCFREYYMPNKLVSEHRANIHSLSSGEHYSFQLADPSIFYKTQQKYGGRWCTADEYSDVKNLPRDTAIWWQPADNNEMGTRNRISEYLRVDPERIHPITKLRGSPRLFFVIRTQDWPQGCDHTLRELKSARRKRLGSDLGRPIFSDDRDEGIVDHAYDCVRYFIASRPPVMTEAAKVRSANSFNAKREQMEEFRRRGGWRRLALDARRRRA